MELRQHFEAISTLLLKYQHIWKDVPFKDKDLTILASYPELKVWLFELTDEQVLHYQRDTQALLEACSPFFSDAQTIRNLIQLPEKKLKKQKMPAFWEQDIPGRKAQQIEAFILSLKNLNLPIIEWCCGKQHLSRTLFKVYQQPAIGFEIDPNLVTQAQQLSSKQGCEDYVNTVECNVLSPQIYELLNPEQHHIALHACGGLHRQLLTQCAKAQINSVSISPCCYHKFSETAYYQPLSEAGKDSSLEINTQELRLAVREPMTASSSENEKRRKLQAWRLGYDLLQRKWRGIDAYLDLPSLNTQILKNDFQAFCHEMANRQKIRIQPEGNLTLFEKQGAQRLFYLERAELIQMIFKRLLEVWLNLDLAMFLEEQGYLVELSSFCSQEITPRNIFLEAQRQNT